MEPSDFPTIWHHSIFAHQGGAARVANSLAAGLAAAGWKTRQTFERRDAAHPGQLADVSELTRLAADGDMLHLHTVENWPPALEALSRRPFRLVCTLHDTRLTGGDPSLAGARLAATFSQLAPVLVSPSRCLLHLARQRLDPEGLLPVRLVPNGVEFPAGAPAPGRAARENGRRRWGIAPAAKVVLFSAHGGEQAAQKGGAHWREIWLAVKGAHPDTVGIMAGADKHEREGDLLRLPYMGRDDLHTLLAAADLFLYPSLADNHPLAVLEAFAAGTPVLAFAVGGIPEQIEPGKTGWMLPPGDWTAFSRSAAQLLENAAALRAAGRAAHERWQQRFTLEHMVQGYQTVYREILERSL